MRVLVVDEWLCWPLDNGKKIRTWNLLARLARDHEIILVAYGSRDGEPAAFAHLEQAGIEVRALRPPRVHKSGIVAGGAALLSAARGLPYSAAMYARPEMTRAVEDCVRNDDPDLVHVETSVLGTVTPRSLGIPRVLGTHNFEAQIWKRLAERDPNPIRKLAYQSQAMLMRRFERRSIIAFDRVTAVSTDDARRLGELTGRTDIVVVPNGVDIQHFGNASPPTHPHSLVFTGALDWRPTQDAVQFLVEEVFPRVRERVPDARLTVAGRDPSERIRGLARDAAGVTLAANVPDIRVPVAEASVSIAPIRSGSGSRLKILEAMAMGRPVVATTIGAEGLGAIDGEHLLLAEDAGDLAGQVVRLWSDEALYASVATAARSFVERNFDWDTITHGLDRVWHGAVA